MSAPVYQSQDADIDIGRLFSAIWRDKFRILAGALIITVLAWLALSMVTPKYESDARILVESNESVFTRPASGEGGAINREVDLQSVASQVEIMTSSDLLLGVAQDLGFASLPEFDETRSMSTLKMGLVTLGLVADPTELPTEQRILRNMRKNLDVYPVKNSRVIVIKFRSADPLLAEKVPNAIAAAYLALQNKSELETTGQAADYLAGEIAELQESVRIAEARVEEFRSANGLFETAPNSILSTQQLAQISTELSRVRAERASVEARVQSMETALGSGASLDTLPDVISSPLISRLREQQIRLDGEIADLSTTLLPGHPRIKALVSQRDDLAGRVRTEAGKILSGLRNEASIARDRETELTAELNQLKVASTESGSSEVELRALEREAASQRALLESYLIRFREAQSRDETAYVAAKARLISRAVMPVEPAFPKMIPLLAAIFAASLILMVLVTLLRELFSGDAFVVPVAQMPAEAANDAPSAPARSVATAAATAASGNGHWLATDPEAGVEPTIDPQADNDNFSVTALAGHLEKRGAGRVIVLSPEGEDGSACSVGLARALADDGLRTILVDLTGTSASSRHMLSRFGVPGITNLLSAEASYSDIIHPDAATQAHVIPTGTADPARAMRAVERLPMILDALSSAYDIIVVDCGLANARAIKRLTTPETEIVMSVTEGDKDRVLAMAEDLLEGGYDDVLVMTPDPLTGPSEPGPGLRRVNAR